MVSSWERPLSGCPDGFGHYGDQRTIRGCLQARARQRAPSAARAAMGRLLGFLSPLLTFGHRSSSYVLPFGRRRRLRGGGRLRGRGQLRGSRRLRGRGRLRDGGRLRGRGRLGRRRIIRGLPMKTTTGVALGGAFIGGWCPVPRTAVLRSLRRICRILIFGARFLLSPGIARFHGFVLEARLRPRQDTDQRPIADRVPGLFG